tara:strand:+ start:1590 stop:1781 length:192 start_codon:yes stop_codon:yes gene_type:complete
MTLWLRTLFKFSTTINSNNEKNTLYRSAVEKHMMSYSDLDDTIEELSNCLRSAVKKRDINDGK